MLSNAYFLAKFRFDTAENEPAKNLQNLLILKFPNFANPSLFLFLALKSRTRPPKVIPQLSLALQRLFRTINTAGSPRPAGPGRDGGEARVADKDTNE